MRKIWIVLLFLLIPGYLWAQGETSKINTPAPTVGQGKKIGISSASRRSSLPRSGQGINSTNKDHAGSPKDGQGISAPDHGNRPQHGPGVRVPNSRPGGPITRPTALPGNRPVGPRQRPGN